MKPFEVDTVAAIKTIEQARFDRTFRQAISGFRTIAIGRTAFWNNSPVTLVDVSQFADRDLLVFKIEWSNNTGSVLNLDCGQVRLKVANTGIPITCSQQVAAQLFPGQCDTIWLFVQGCRLSPCNDWCLLLPPDAAAVQKIVSAQIILSLKHHIFSASLNFDEASHQTIPAQPARAAVAG
jgi:hypothetical protein